MHCPIAVFCTRDAVMTESSYADERRRVCEAAGSNGYEAPDSLRELLICTTSTVTASMAEAYFAERRNDARLLNLLVAIALEGEDAGDAPGSRQYDCELPGENVVAPQAESGAVSRRGVELPARPKPTCLSEDCGRREWQVTAVALDRGGITVFRPQCLSRRGR